MRDDSGGVARPETAVRRIAKVAGAVSVCTRLGSRDDIRRMCGVSAGILSDAAWHSSPANLARYRAQVAAMSEDRDRADTAAFMAANSHLHELLAQVNPSPLLRTIYRSVRLSDTPLRGMKVPTAVAVTALWRPAHASVAAAGRTMGSRRACRC